jgi:anti-sigma B factor antagonist
MDSSRMARKAILASLEDGHDTLVDMSEVAYIDSSGIATLIEGRQLAKNKGLNFGLVEASLFVMSVLELARLDKVFDIYSSINDLE